MQRNLQAAVLLALAGLVGYGLGAGTTGGDLRALAQAALRDVRPPVDAPFQGESSGVAAVEVLIRAESVRRYEQHRWWKRILENPDDREEIQGKLRRRVGALLQAHPPIAHGAVSREPWRRTPELETDLVRIPTYEGVEIRAVLVRPLDAGRSTPGILAIHGNGGDPYQSLHDVDYHHAFAARIAEQGYTVLAPHVASSTALLQSRLKILAAPSGWNVEALDLGQLRVALDYLRRVEGVDPDRVGVYGISQGGAQALRLAATDQRLSLAVVSGYFTDRFRWLFDRTAFRPLHHVASSESMAWLDDLNLVSLVAPRRLVISVGRGDGRFDGANGQFPFVSKLYSTWGCAEGAALVNHEGGHEVALSDTLPFLNRWRDGEWLCASD